jgi:hypothetical protein
VADIHFHIDGNQFKDILDWDDLEIIANRDIPHAKPMLAKFVVDKSGNPVKFDAALKLLGKLKWSEIEDVSKQFFDAFNAATLNPTTGGPSSPPSNPVDGRPSGGDN